MLNRIAKWAAVGVLAIATIPTVGMARTRASLPSAAVTQTPASPVGIKSTKKVSRKHTVSHKRPVSKASAKKSVHKSKAHKTVSHKKPVHKTSRKHVSHKKTSK